MLFGQLLDGGLPTRLGEGDQVELTQPVSAPMNVWLVSVRRNERPLTFDVIRFVERNTWIEVTDREAFLVGISYATGLVPMVIFAQGNKIIYELRRRG